MPIKELHEEEKRGARETAKLLKEVCKHLTNDGYCLQFNEICFYDEDMKLCPDYSPKYSIVKIKNDRK